jgi:hypothetical protein
MTMVWDRTDFHILASMHPTKKADSSYNVSDLDSISGHFRVFMGH